MDNCTIYEKQTIERIQYEAARIVTGLTRSVSIDNLLSEIGWVSLSDRRVIQKLTLVYKHKESILPTYLSDLFPLSVNETTPYNLRNNNDFATLPRRLEIYSKSVIPSSLKLWNDLDTNIRDSPSLVCFKSRIKELFKPPIVPKFFLIGERSQSIYHARIRNNCSNLNFDLFNNHLKDNPNCLCGEGVEDAKHFFFKCNCYLNERLRLFTNTRQFHPLSTDKLLFEMKIKQKTKTESYF